jgi:hypothetical protein
MTLPMVLRTTFRRTFGATSISTSSEPSFTLVTVPRMPPPVMIRSPRFSEVSIVRCSLARFCCGRMSRK